MRERKDCGSGAGETSESSREDMAERTNGMAEQEPQQQARAWVVRLTSGAATQADAEALRRWRAATPENERAFQEAARLWRLAGEALAPERLAAARPALRRPPPRLSRRAVLAGAAGMAGAALLGTQGGALLGLTPGLSDLLADHRTGIGEQARVTLPDGSTVDLDARTTLDVAFSERRRETRLGDGAAVFSVAADPTARPFATRAVRDGVTGVVEAAAPARFAIEWRSATACVTCLEGVVSVTAGATSPLGPGMRLLLRAGGTSPLPAVAPDGAAAWRRGLLVFQGRPLADVIAEIERYRPGRILLADTALASRQVSGVFHLGRPDEILDHLHHSLNIPLRRLGPVVLLG